MKDEKTQILLQFKNELITFFDELIDIFPSEGDLVMIRIFLKDQIPIEDVMIIFNNIVNKEEQKFKNMIKERNETFFLESNMFDSISKTKALHFKKLWRSGRLDPEDKDIIWKWVNSFVYLADKYIKIKNN
jgi:hypothetical protein